MGYYINPPNKTKEQWLKENGIVINSLTVNTFDFSGDHLPVCLVDNGAFKAAGIAYCPAERDEFAHPDGRPKIWYMVKRELLKPWYDE